mmetsp:Transcript_22119/g.37645  ORF Transcript_22119/g.37645 Transcript_22119/m.37645 type:complete len:245 (-) Transcript_22119:251-985(-)
MSHDLHFTVEGGAQPTGMMDSAAPPPDPTQTARSKYSLQNSSHPTVCLFHILFKVASLGLYIFGGFFTKGPNKSANFITVTVFCILLLAADFWVTKNITGRLLVGLRWWNQVEGETTRWIFESKGEAVKNRFDVRVFWTVLYTTPVAWGCLFFLGLLRLEFGWLLVVCVALALSASNVYGYYKCSSDQKAKFQQMMVQGAQRGAMAAVRSNLFGMLVGGSGGDSSAANGSAPAPQQTPSPQTYV